MNQNTVHRFLKVAAADVFVARELCKTIAGVPGDLMFLATFSPTGNAPPTHYISSGLIEAQFAGLLGDSNATFAAYKAFGGVTITLAQVQTMYANAEIRGDTLGYEQVVLGLLGLKSCPSQ